MAKIDNKKFFGNVDNFSDEDSNYNMEDDKMSDDEEKFFVSGIGAVQEKRMINSDKTCENVEKLLHSDDEFEYSNPKIAMTNIVAQKKDYENEKLLSESEMTLIT